jgi:hypothetical protein
MGPAPAGGLKMLGLFLGSAQACSPSSQVKAAALVGRLKLPEKGRSYGGLSKACIQIIARTDYLWTLSASWKVRF